jgi:hypothetical protein
MEQFGVSINYYWHNNNIYLIPAAKLLVNMLRSNTRVQCTKNRLAQHLADTHILINTMYYDKIFDKSERESLQDENTASAILEAPVAPLLWISQDILASLLLEGMGYGAKTVFICLGQLQPV